MVPAHILVSCFINIHFNNMISLMPYTFRPQQKKNTNIICFTSVSIRSTSLPTRYRSINPHGSLNIRFPPHRTCFCDHFRSRWYIARYIRDPYSAWMGIRMCVSDIFRSVTRSPEDARHYWVQANTDMLVLMLNADTETSVAEAVSSFLNSPNRQCCTKLGLSYFLFS